MSMKNIVVLVSGGGTNLQALLDAQERGEILYLHADSEDTPKELYAKMGFQAVDKLYEYLCTDFSKLKI